MQHFGVAFPNPEPRAVLPAPLGAGGCCSLERLGPVRAAWSCPLDLNVRGAGIELRVRACRAKAPSAGRLRSLPPGAEGTQAYQVSMTPDRNVET